VKPNRHERRKDHAIGKRDNPEPAVNSKSMVLGMLNQAKAERLKNEGHRRMHNPGAPDHDWSPSSPADLHRGDRLKKI
jgi:hypothetical protein